MTRKPGALPGATALERARAAGTFTTTHEASWSAACKAHGDTEGTRALIEVLVLHRHMRRADVLAGISVALAAGALTADVVALEARKAADNSSAEVTQSDRPLLAEPASTVPSLTQRRLTHLPTDTRPLPSVTAYDELLSHKRRTDNQE